jgi:hypothetical protein
MTEPLERSLSDIIAHGVEADLPAPDTTEPMVTRSVRLPVSTSKLLDEMAAGRDIGPTVLARQFIEAGLAELRAETTMVPLADVRRLLASLAHRPPAA